MNVLMIALLTVGVGAQEEGYVDEKEIQKRATEVSSRYDVDMCAFDVLCADDPVHPGVVSADLREELPTVSEKEGSKKVAITDEVPTDANKVAATFIKESTESPLMVDSGRESLCKCVLGEQMTNVDDLYKRMSQICIGKEKSPSALWFSEQGRGRRLLLNWAGKAVNDACGRENDITVTNTLPPCDWSYAVKRISQQGKVGILNYANDIECAWRLSGWKPPKRRGSAAKTLLRTQLRPISEVINNAKNEIVNKR